MREMSPEERAHWRELLDKGRKTPADILWMKEHAIVGKRIVTEHGIVEGCINFILVQTPEEIAERKRICQETAARLYYNRVNSTAF